MLQSAYKVRTPLEIYWHPHGKAHPGYEPQDKIF